ncbi:MAG: hypothetical protein MJ252_07495 [archaeon]|nr:hypothetical protein [archaeon]
MERLADDEVLILVEDTFNKIHTLKIRSPCKFKELKKKLKDMFNVKIDNVIFGEAFFSKDEEVCTFDNLNKIQFNRDDVTLECCSYVSSGPLLNLAFFENESDKNVDFGIDVKKVYLSGILNLCLLKFIAKKMDDSLINKIKSESVRNLIIKVKNEVTLKGNVVEDIVSILKEDRGINIFEYCKYVTTSVKESDLNDLVSLFGNEDAKQIESFWKKLSVYQEFNKLFEEELNKALRESYFDYSAVSIAIYQTSGVKNYIDYKKECKNRLTKFLFHGTQIDPITKIVTDQFKYTRKAFYGMGIYFSDMLDYAEFYAGGKTYEDRRKFFGKTLPIDNTFSCIATEVYFDKTKLKKVYDWSLHVNELDHFPTYDELLSKYKSKMVEKNGINLAKVEPKHGQVLTEDDIKKSKNMVCTEYVVTELSQILPLYCLTLKRKEYFIVWRDNHFEGQNDYSDFLKERRIFINEKADMNAYFEPSVEGALKLIERKKHNKIILLSNIALDLSGKTFVDVARKILGFNAMALFFSANNNNLKWLKNYPNALYTTSSTFFEKYVTNYKEKELKDLKKEVEACYGVKFPEFTKDFLGFPKFINQEKYENIPFSEKLDFFRHVFIYNQRSNSYLCLNLDGTVSLRKDKNMPLWDVTILDDITTLFTNKLYLGITEDKTGVHGEKYMKRWKIVKKSSSNKFNLVFIPDSDYVNAVLSGHDVRNLPVNASNSILTIEGNKICLKNNGSDAGALFEFVDA